MTGEEEGKVFSVYWINIMSYKAQTGIEVTCLLTYFYIQSL